MQVRDCKPTHLSTKPKTINNFSNNASLQPHSGHLEKHLKMKHVPANWLRTAASAIVSPLAMISFAQEAIGYGIGGGLCGYGVVISELLLVCQLAGLLHMIQFTWPGRAPWNTAVQHMGHIVFGIWYSPFGIWLAVSGAWELMHDWRCANLFQVLSLAETESGEVLISMTN